MDIGKDLSYEIGGVHPSRRKMDLTEDDIDWVCDVGMKTYTEVNYFGMSVVRHAIYDSCEFQLGEPLKERIVSDARARGTKKIARKNNACNFVWKFMDDAIHHQNGLVRIKTLLRRYFNGLSLWN